MKDNYRSILPRLKKDLATYDEVGIVPTRKLATIFIILSGILLYLDKIFLALNITLSMPSKFEASDYDFHTFLWLICATVFSPIFLIIGVLLKPYKIAFLIPIYCFSLQGYFVLLSGRLIEDNGYLYAYSFVSTLLIFTIIEGIKMLSKRYIKSLISQQKAELKQQYDNQ